MLKVNQYGKELKSYQNHGKEKRVSITDALFYIDKNKRFIDEMNEKRMEIDRGIAEELRQKSVAKIRLSEQQMYEFQNYCTFKEAVKINLEQLYLQLTEDFRLLINQGYRMTQRGKLHLFVRLLRQYLQEQELIKTFLRISNTYSDLILTSLRCKTGASDGTCQTGFADNASNGELCLLKTEHN